jgi:hypothetical protein
MASDRDRDRGRNRNERNDRRVKKNENELGPLEVYVDAPYDAAALEKAMRRFNRLIKKDGVLKEFMWRTQHRESREQKPQCFDK